MLKKYILVVAILSLPAIGWGVGEKIDLPIKRIGVAPQKITVASGVEIRPELNEEFADYTFEYRWFVNGEPDDFETSEKYPGNLLKRGDKLKVEIIPVGFVESDQYSAVVPEMEVMNAAPRITSRPPQKLSGDSFAYQAEAEDPDGDDLRFSLIDEPEGMSIDPVSGLLSWIYTPEGVGALKFKIVVEDGFDGRDEQNVEMTLSSVESGVVNE